jgi:hypothetical protein
VTKDLRGCEVNNEAIPLLGDRNGPGENDGSAGWGKLCNTEELFEKMRWVAFPMNRRYRSQAWQKYRHDAHRNLILRYRDISLIKKSRRIRSSICENYMVVVPGATPSCAWNKGCLLSRQIFKLPKLTHDFEKSLPGECFERQSRNRRNDVRQGTAAIALPTSTISRGSRHAKSLSRLNPNWPARSLLPK